MYDSACPNNIEHRRTLLNLFQDQIPKSDRFYAKIDYLNLPVRQEFSGTKPIRIEEIEEKIISKLTQNITTVCPDAKILKILKLIIYFYIQTQKIMSFFWTKIFQEPDFDLLVLYRY